MNIASPRRGSPQVSVAACVRIRVRCSTYLYITPASATTKRSAARTPKVWLVEGDRMRALRSFEPFVEESQRREAVDQPPGYPHYETGEALVVDRIEADAGHAHCRIVGVPRARREAHQGTKRSADQ